MSQKNKIVPPYAFPTLVNPENRKLKKLFRPEAKRELAKVERLERLQHRKPDVGSRYLWVDQKPISQLFENVSKSDERLVAKHLFGNARKHVRVSDFRHLRFSPSDFPDGVFKNLNTAYSALLGAQFKVFQKPVFPMASSTP